MSDKMHEINAIESQDILQHDKEHTHFKKTMLALSALAGNCLDQKQFDIYQAADESQFVLKTLNANGALQEMLAAQLYAIHRLQQVSMNLAGDISDMRNKQYFTNTAIKLANTFIQQANLLARLQGHGGQKIVVEHVDVHQGGQAIIGNINTGAPVNEIKK